MEGMILVGGAPYQGKTKFVNELLMSKPEKYKNLGLDFLKDEMERDRSKLIKYCAMMPPEMKSAFRINEDYDFSHMEDNNLLSTLFMQATVMLGVADGLRTAGLGTVPIIESLFYNQDARIGFYDSCKDYLEILRETSPSDLPEVNLDEIPKTLVFFDRGINASLKRQNRDDTIRPRFTERDLQKYYALQSIPKNDELPNLTVCIIRREEDLYRALKLFG